MTPRAEYIGLQSMYLVSECCNSPVLLTYDFPMDSYNVHCGACTRMLARPTGLDVWLLEHGDLPQDRYAA